MTLDTALRDELLYILVGPLQYRHVDTALVLLVVHAALLRLLVPVSPRLALRCPYPLYHDVAVVPFLEQAAAVPREP